jgi:hypothetical protein
LQTHGSCGRTSSPLPAENSSRAVACSINDSLYTHSISLASRSSNMYNRSSVKFALFYIPYFNVSF